MDREPTECARDFDHIVATAKSENLTIYVEPIVGDGDIYRYESYEIEDGTLKLRYSDIEDSERHYQAELMDEEDEIEFIYEENEIATFYADGEEGRIFYA